MKPGTVGIIGGGAAGMAAAIAAGRQGDRVILLEALDRTGKKLSATGNGRCNLMNRHPEAYYGDPDFAAAVLGPDPLGESLAFWRSLGLPVRFDSDGRGYPCTFLAGTVLDVLRAEMRRLDTEIRTGASVTDVEPDGSAFILRLADGTSLRADRVILATGGGAQAKLGGNFSAWPWLERLGHRMAAARPALVPLKTDKKAISGLSGLRVKCRVSLESPEGEVLHREQGEMLFTDTGISGICVMQCARFLPESGGAVLFADFVRDLFPDRQALKRTLLERAALFPKDMAQSLLRGLCADKLAYAVCKQAGLALRGETIGQLSEKQIGNVADALAHYRIPILGTEGMERAQVMAGGADCGLFRPENMESRIWPGLHAAGEILNVDGDCRGYNLMFAFLSGIRAGENGRREKHND